MKEHLRVEPTAAEVFLLFRALDRVSCLYTRGTRMSKRCALLFRALGRASLVLPVRCPLVVCALVLRGERHPDGPQEVAEARREAARARAQKRYLRPAAHELAIAESMCKEVQGGCRWVSGWMDGWRRLVLRDDNIL